MYISPRVRMLAAALLVTFRSGCAISPAGPDARTYRIGFQHTPPRQFVDAQGKPYGSVIDLLQGAARRAHPGKRIFMPISPCRLLIGAQQEPKMTDVDVSAVNQAFSRCSLEFFISARRLDSSEAHLIESIGLWSGIADDGELNAVWEQIRNDL